MLFNSLEYLIFFPIVVGLYFAVPFRVRWVLLLLASYFFYASWRLEYLVLIILSTVVDYVAAIKMAEAVTKRGRKWFLALSLIVNLGLLFVFKYYAFFIDSATFTLESFGLMVALPELKVLLPVGISFYTFQTLSYTIDVYMGRRKPERHLGIFAVYVSFFPQLVAGPIERSTHLLPQFFVKHSFEYQRLTRGLQLILWGLVKKVVIADRLAMYVDPIFDAPGSHDGMTLLVASIFFAAQIYCDFSGYSDIAIGSAKIMGFDLMTNFRQPYFARSIREFWQRWHISLSTWFRDYVYIPLGGSRAAPSVVYANLFVTFLVSGLWHGANWTFVVWGGLHGFYLMVERILESWREQYSWSGALSRMGWLWVLGKVIWINILVLVGWVLFRSNNLADAWLIFNRIGQDLIAGTWNLTYTAPLDVSRDVQFLGIMLVLLAVYDLLLRMNWRLLRQPYFAWSAMAFQFWCLVVYGVFNTQQFIYFQF